MKKTHKRTTRLFRPLLFLLSALLSVSLQAQTCVTPLSLTVNDCDNYTVSDSVVWLSFNSGSGASWCSINITPPSPGSITGAELYSGTCTSLTLVQTGFNDLGEFVVRSNISASTNYLVKVVRNNSSSAQLNVCLNVVTSTVPCPQCAITGCQLVCNPDLESYQLADAQQHPANFLSANVCNWGSAGVGTPDYFNVNSGDTTVDVPSNFQGTETPHSGNSYGGFYCFYNLQGQYREYVQHQLQSPLVAGQWYTLTFWVSLGDYSGYAVNHLGAYISSTAPVQTPFPNVLTFTPQVVYNGTITTINGWVPITGTFQATAGMQWITIGSFETDQVQQQTVVVPIGNNPFPTPPGNPNLGSYYYIDDITLENYPDPTFTWFGTCKVNFVNNLDCVDPASTHSWNFGDPSSGANNTSSLQNPSHTFTQNGTQYTVTHTITTPTGGVYTYTAIVIQSGPPTANIVGYQTNNCGNGTINYTANPCASGISYSWIVTGGTPSTTTGCSTNINWGANGGYVILVAWDQLNDCTGYDTLQIPSCCDSPVPSTVKINNRTASSVLSDPLFSAYVTGSNFTTNNEIIVNGVFTIDVPFAFVNCANLNFGANALTYTNPGQTLTYDNTKVLGKCDTMWDGNHISDVTATVRIINGSILQQAKRCVYSMNGGNYFIENSTLRNNYKDIVVDAFNGNHPGVVRGTNFTMPGTFQPAIPALPFGHTKTVCAIEIVDNANITIGDASSPAYQNNFTNIFVGVRSKNSSTNVQNCRFANLTATLQQVLTVPDAGTGVVAIGQKNFLYQPQLTVGGTLAQRCIFVNMRTAIDTREVLHVTVLNNNISDVRMYGIRIQRAGGRNIKIQDNKITNQSAAFAFNTAILVLDCYDATVNIYTNFILQTSSTVSNYGLQTGTGIRVSLATPGDINLNIVGNNSINRVKTGIHVQNLTGKNKVFITNNVINFTKPNGAYTSIHAGIKLQNCATVKVRYNDVSKNAGAPVQAMEDKLRGVSMENSTVTVISHNVFTRMGSGVYGWELCGGSAMVCDTFKGCFDGFLFRGGPLTNGACDIGDQVIDQSTTTPTPAPTGCKWNSCVADIAGKIDSIHWYRSAAYIPSLNLVPGSLIPANTTIVSGNQSACNLPQYFAPQTPLVEREENAAQAVFNSGSYAPGSEQGYQGRRNAHRKLRANPTWMTIGTPQDSAYSGFYVANDQGNIGLFRNFEDMAAVDSVQAAGNILANITDSNYSEANLKVVYSIYQQTWMQGIDEFTPSDSAVLYGIAIQYASEAGEAVYSARVLLGLDVDEYAASSARYGNSDESADVAVQPMSLFPNPATDQLTVNATLVEGQSSTIVITDLQGKVVLSQNVTTSGQMLIDVSTLDNGMYFVQMVVDGVLIETNKLEVIHE